VAASCAGRPPLYKELVIEDARSASRGNGLSWVVAAIAFVVAAALAAWGTFGDPKDGGGWSFEEWDEYLALLAIMAAAAALVFGGIVPRTARSGAYGRNGVILGALGLLTLPVFWSGLPPIFAFGAAFLGWHGRERGNAIATTVAMALGVLVLAADLVVYITDLT
jgi:hypothetical protein